MLKGLAVGAAMSVVAGAAHAEVTTAVRQETAPVRGLGAPAEIIVDRWGIPHIYAASSRDAFFLQGWNAARDRLWQIDLWRKRGLGRGRNGYLGIDILCYQLSRPPVDLNALVDRVAQAPAPTTPAVRALRTDRPGKQRIL